MKKNSIYFVISLLFAVTFGQSSFAQSNAEEIDYIQSVVGMEKKAALAEFLAIEKDASFWAIYDAYETERKELGKSRISLLENYANNYEAGMADEVTDDIIKQMQAQKKALDVLIDQYYKKIRKDSGAKVAAQFYQFENFVLSAVRLEILASIPFIGELDN